MNASIIALLLKVSVILSLAAVAATVLRKSSAARRHFVWFGAMASVIVLVVLQLFVPAIVVPVAEQSPLAIIAHASDDTSIPIRFSKSQTNIVSSSETTDLSSTADNTSQAPFIGDDVFVAINEWRLSEPLRSQQSLQVPASIDNPDLKSVLNAWRAKISAESVQKSWLVLWFAGSVFLLIRLANAHMQLQRVAQSSQPETNLALLAEVATIAGSFGVDKPVQLLVHRDIDTPCTAGWRNPIILLPTNHTEWSDQRRRAVITHELAHISRGDSIAQTVASIACALFWFHPGFWVAARMLRAEGERAADDCVISSGMSAIEYADHLLAIANRSSTLTRSPAAALGMARTSQLETRMRAMLNGAQSRSTLTRGLQRTLGTVALLLVIPFAGLQARVQEIPAKPQPPVVLPSKVQPSVKATPAAPPKVVQPALEKAASPAAASKPAMPTEPKWIEKPNAAAPTEKPPMVVAPAKAAKPGEEPRWIEKPSGAAPAKKPPMVIQPAKPAGEGAWVEKSSGAAPAKAEQPAMPKKMSPPPPPAKEEIRAAVPKKMPPPPPPMKDDGSVMPSKQNPAGEFMPTKGDIGIAIPKKAVSPSGMPIATEVSADMQQKPLTLQSTKNPKNRSQINAEKARLTKTIASLEKQQRTAEAKYAGLEQAALNLKASRTSAGKASPSRPQSTKRPTPKHNNVSKPSMVRDTLFDKSIEVSGNDALNLRIKRVGRLVFHSTNERKVRVSARIPQTSTLSSTVSLERVSNGVAIVVDGSSDNTQRTYQASYEIWIPGNMEVFAEPSGGPGIVGLTVSGLWVYPPINDIQIDATLDVFCAKVIVAHVISRLSGKMACGTQNKLSAPGEPIRVVVNGTPNSSTYRSITPPGGPLFSANATSLRALESIVDSGADSTTFALSSDSTTITVRYAANGQGQLRWSTKRDGTAKPSPKIENLEPGNINVPIKASTLADLVRADCGVTQVSGTVTRTRDGDIVSGTVRMLPQRTGVSSSSDSVSAALRNKMPLMYVDGILQNPPCH